MPLWGPCFGNKKNIYIYISISVKRYEIGQKRVCEKTDQSRSALLVDEIIKK